MGKGMSIGAVIALVIGGAGMDIPEMTMLASIFKKKLVVMIVLVIFLTAVVSGYLFNIYYIMDKKEEKKGFWASLFAPKSCCCGPQIEEIKE